MPTKITAATANPDHPARLQQLAIRHDSASRRLNAANLRRLLRRLLRTDLNLGRFILGLHFVDDASITHLNETFLRHAGVTDVISFDQRDDHPDAELAGEIFVCVPEAVRQSRRYHTPWPVEILRYVVHGILHLLGHEDHTPTRRRRMKTVENRLIQTLIRRGDVPQPNPRPLRPFGPYGQKGRHVHQGPKG